MVKTIRFLATAAWLVTVIVIGTVFRQNIEEFAADRGLNVLFKDGGLVVMSLGYGIWAILAFVFMSGAALAVWIDYFIRPKNSFKTTKRKIEREFTGKRFQNCEIRLDGASYTGCSFINVKFIYNGGVSTLKNNKIYGCIISSEIEEINRYSLILGEFGFLSKPVFNDDGEISFNGIKKEDI